MLNSTLTMYISFVTSLILTPFSLSYVHFVTLCLILTRVVIKWRPNTPIPRTPNQSELATEDHIIKKKKEKKRKATSYRARSFTTRKCLNNTKAGTQMQGAPPIEISIIMSARAVSQWQTALANEKRWEFGLWKFCLVHAIEMRAPHKISAGNRLLFD